MEFMRPWTLPPGTPYDRLETLRRAFEAAMNDPQFIEEANRSRLPIHYTSGAKAAQLVDKIISTPGPVIESLTFLVQKR
jgi:tripartite-type tricarboxylate transporter receptor subunit TctC